MDNLHHLSFDTRRIITQSYLTDPFEILNAIQQVNHNIIN